MSEGNVGIHIGAKIEPKGFDSLTKAIIKIATASPFEDVNLAALDALKTISRVENVTVTGSTVAGTMAEPYAPRTPLVHGTPDPWEALDV